MYSVSAEYSVEMFCRILCRNPRTLQQTTFHVITLGSSVFSELWLQNDVPAISHSLDWHFQCVGSVDCWVTIIMTSYTTHGHSCLLGFSHSSPLEIFVIRWALLLQLGSGELSSNWNPNHVLGPKKVLPSNSPQEMGKIQSLIFCPFRLAALRSGDKI